MSIITDALKKAESARGPKASQTAEEARAAACAEEAIVPELTWRKLGPKETRVEKDGSPAARERSSRRFVSFSLRQFLEILILLAIVLLSLGVLFVLPRWSPMGRNFSVIGEAVQKAVVAPRGVFRQEIPQTASPKVEEVSAKLPFTLSGISAWGADRYALINGVVVEKGDSIDGARVKEIFDRAVILETNAGEVKLKIRT